MSSFFQKTAFFIFMLMCLQDVAMAATEFRINRPGYLPLSEKTAVLLSDIPLKNLRFEVADALSMESAGTFSMHLITSKVNDSNFAYQLDFSSLQKPGTYIIKTENKNSGPFKINADIYRNYQEDILMYLRNNRTKNSQQGAWWTDGSRTMLSPGMTAITCYQLLDAYQTNPAIFADQYDDAGNNLPDEIPDILNEAKYGIDFLLKKHPVYMADSLQKTNPGQHFKYASLAGKYASALMLASDVLEPFYPGNQSAYISNAEKLYQTGINFPGVFSNPAVPDPLNSEKNWMDDMQLAALHLYFNTLEDRYLQDGIAFGQAEPVPQWIYAGMNPSMDWFPLVNHSLPLMAQLENPELRTTSRLNFKNILQRIMPHPDSVNSGKFTENPAQLTAMYKLAFLYRHITRDESFFRTEKAVLNTLSGCNNSGLYLKDYINGQKQDNHWPDITFVSSVLQLIAGEMLQVSVNQQEDKKEYFRGALSRTDISKKQISLLWVGHDYDDGFKTVLKTLERTQVKATFFLTTVFINKPGNLSLLKKLIKQGHQAGIVGVGYQSVCNKIDPDMPAMSKEQFLRNLRISYNVLKKAGLKKDDAPYYFPPYEMYNDSIIAWCREYGVIPVRSTPGTLSGQDNSIPSMREEYYSTREIFDDILQTENESGLNGYIFQFYLGTNPIRKDKFYNSLIPFITTLRKQGYVFTDLKKGSELSEKK
jgi:peptidoglycan/xylan/chitin deacetylase (PgdA/CDA1 family)